MESYFYVKSIRDGTFGIFYILVFVCGIAVQVRLPEREEPASNLESDAGTSARRKLRANPKWKTGGSESKSNRKLTSDSIDEESSLSGASDEPNLPFNTEQQPLSDLLQDLESTGGSQPHQETEEEQFGKLYNAIC